ncbi:MAG: hypothetical protein J7L66_03975 [Anaerolineaceae bacterium]|nr:hypothetical protein [Anaerolineaceae bacterium]
MVIKLRKLIIVVALASMMLVSACTVGGVEEPTPDINAIRTEAVQTAKVEMTVQEALAPKETQLPPTLTPLPSATLSTDAAQPAAGSSSSSNSGSSSSGASVTAVPSWTPDVYRCEFVTQDPLDGPQMTGWIYDMKWTIRNVGTATWTKKDYYVKWTGGDDISPKHIYKLKHDVGYYEKIDIVVDIEIPTQPKIYPGYVTNWAIVNDNGEVFCRFYHHVTLTYPAPTRTPTPQ